jgi:tRNA(Ile)-lysidine synthase
MPQAVTNTATAWTPQSDVVSTDQQSLSALQFSRLMQALGPYERAPVLGVGVSGGADSTALALLAHEWAFERGGRVHALIVDHGLRPESAREAEGVAAICVGWGMTADVLTWNGHVPVTGIEEAARSLRHQLLDGACRRHGLMHLLLAHHGNDQAETADMRRTMGSGPLGLAGMSVCVERPHYRLLRPLLSVSRARLEGTLRERGIGWIDDPMNHDLTFARARLRRDGALPYDPAAGQNRAAIEQELAEILPRIVTLDSLGRAQLDRIELSRMQRPLACLAISRIAQAVGGLDYPPRMSRLETLVSRLTAPGPLRATLGRCLWRGGALLTVSREHRNLPFQDVQGGDAEVLWDGRFRLKLPAGAWSIGPVAMTQWRDLAAQSGKTAPAGIKNPEFGALPAVYDLEGMVAVPHLGYASSARLMACRARFAPRQPLVPAKFVGAGAMEDDRR